MMRLEADISRRRLLGGAGAMLGLFAGLGAGTSGARARTPPRPLLLTNLRLFDGIAERLREDVNVLIEGPRIAALPPRGEPVEGVETIDCGGRVVIPGLIDAHWHATLVAVTQVQAMTVDPGLIHLMAGREAGRTLRRGFTTVRDTGGPAFPLAQAIDLGVIEGPRIFPSGAMISQTSGHGDFRMIHELPRSALGGLSHMERQGVAAIADGADAVLMRTREQLMRGASQVKVMAGGGVASPYDPLDTAQFLDEELRAAVRAAEDWGTYVCAHVYTPKGIERALRAGVRSIEHGQLADADSARMMAATGAWWSLQPFLMDEDANVYPDPARRAAQARVSEGTVRAFELAERFGVRTAFGTDILMSPANLPSQGRQLAKLTRFRSPLAVLKMATGDNGELLAMSGPRAPYDGRLGIVAPGAFADLLAVEGDPETSLDFLADPEANLKLILKDGRVVKRTL